MKGFMVFPFGVSSISFGLGGFLLVVVGDGAD
jgi:hypothetical protein